MADVCATFPLVVAVVDLVVATCVYAVFVTGESIYPQHSVLRS